MSSPAPSAPWRELAAGLRLRLRVQPGAARNRVVGLHDGALKIAVAAPPVDGAANEAVVRLLAKWLAVPRSAVRIVHGHGGREKTVEIATPAPGALAARAQALIADNVDKNLGGD